MNKTEHECDYEYKPPVKGVSYGCLLLVIFLVLSPPLLRFGEAKTMGAAVMAGTGNTPDLLEWSQPSPLPDSVGLAGPFVGVSNDVLIIAGGANFPDGPSWEGPSPAWLCSASLRKELVLLMRGLELLRVQARCCM